MNGGHAVEFGATAAGLRSQARALAELARAEDVGPGDLTAGLLPDGDELGAFALVARGPMVVAGKAIADVVLSAFDERLEIVWADGITDGSRVERADTRLATVSGPIAGVLTAERTLLNFVQRLCGVATLTRTFVDAVRGTRAGIFDTRKTIPGYRVLDKYAVRCGGGCNHRIGLYDAVLIKDNHLAGVETNRLAGFLSGLLSDHPGVRRARFVEVEVDRLDQLREVLKVVGVDVVLLDNFSSEELREAVAIRDAECAGGVLLEASGGVRLDSVGEVARTGVDRISVGAVTHAAFFVDCALERIGA